MAYRANFDIVTAQHQEEIASSTGGGLGSDLHLIQAIRPRQVPPCSSFSVASLIIITILWIIIQ